MASYCLAKLHTYTKEISVLKYYVRTMLGSLHFDKSNDWKISRKTKKFREIGDTIPTV